MTYRPLRFACLLAGLLLHACGGDGPPDLDFSAFDAELDRVRTELGLEGATVAIVHREHGVLYTRGYGSFAPDRVILLASASKMISAGVLVRLADQGLIDLDAPISDYLSEWGIYKSDITVAQLVSNSSGLVGLFDDAIYAPYICQYLPGGTLDTCAYAIYTADDAEDRVPPDTTFRYGGGQWQLAGGIATHVTGKTWATLIEETYVDPCKLDVLGYANPFLESVDLGGETPDLSYPPSIMGDAANIAPTDNPNMEGGGYTTARDYSLLLLMHMRGGRCGSRQVLSPEATARMHTDRIGPAYGGTNGDGYGLGWWIDGDRPTLLYNDGSYGAIAWIDEDRDYGAVILVEDTYSSGAAIQDATQPILDGIFDALAASAEE